MKKLILLAVSTFIGCMQYHHATLVPLICVLVLSSCQRSDSDKAIPELIHIEGVSVKEQLLQKGSVSSVFLYYAVLETTDKGFQNLVKALDLKPANRLMPFSVPSDDRSISWWTPPTPVEQLRDLGQTWYSGYSKKDEVAGRPLGILVWRNSGGVVFLQKSGSSLF